MASKLQAFLGRIEAQAWTFEVTQGGATNITLTAGEYYPKGYDSGSTDIQLVEHIEDELQTDLSDAGITVTLSLTTGLVTIDWNSVSTSVDWLTATDLRDILGFDGNLSAATSHTADYPMRSLWLPTLAPADYPTTIDDLWQPRSSSRVRAAPNSNSHGRKGILTNLTAIPYKLLPSTDVVHHNATYDSEDNATFRSFFRNVIHPTLPIRVVVDRGTYAAAGDYVTALFGYGDDRPIGPFSRYARALPQNKALWDVTVPLVEHDDTT